MLAVTDVTRGLWKTRPEHADRDVPTEFLHDLSRMVQSEYN
jgi:hypothetical protein